MHKFEMLNDDFPKVSVIIPTYNRAHYLQEAIESVLAQSCQNFELIVVDDGSVDNTKEILSAYDDKLKYLYQENEGRSSARNRGIQAAQGQYIAFLDSDDVWMPDKLARQLPVLDAAEPEVVLVHGYKQLVDDGLILINNSEEKLRHYYRFAEKGMETYETYIQHACIFTSTILVRKSALLDIGGYDFTIRGREDLDLYLRLLMKGYSFSFISGPPLIQYRWHEDNTGDITSNLSYLAVYKKHLEICQNLNHSLSNNRTKTLLCQAIAQTYYRLGDFREVRLYWYQSLSQSLTTLLNGKFWRQMIKATIYLFLDNTNENENSTAY